jgi:hypothetical protein
VVSQSGFHRRGHAQRLVNPAKVVVHEIQRYRVLHVLDLFAESVCQPRESPLD